MSICTGVIAIAGGFSCGRHRARSIKTPRGIEQISEQPPEVETTPATVRVQTSHGEGQIGGISMLLRYRSDRKLTLNFIVAHGHIACERERDLGHAGRDMKLTLAAMMMLPMLAPFAQARPIAWQAELQRKFEDPIPLPSGQRLVGSCSKHSQEVPPLTIQDCGHLILISR
jgi:hypothetical protein